MDFGEYAMGAISRLLSGPALHQPIADVGGIEDIDITVPSRFSVDTPNSPDSKKVIPPNFPAIPNVNYVPGNRVRVKYLGWTDYPTEHRPAKIEVAAFDDIMQEVSGEMRKKYAAVRHALHEYIPGHEINVEVMHMPQNEDEHGFWEAQYLKSIEGSAAHMAGLALHKLRLRDGSNNEKKFSKSTSRHYDLGKAFKKYGGCLDEMVGLVGDVISGKPTYQHYADTGPSNTYNIDDYRTGGYMPLDNMAA